MMGLFDWFKKSNYVYAKCKVGDTVYFGKYYFQSEQDKKPIEWSVLESNETELLLISKYCLDTVKYCELSPAFEGTTACIWENSYLRNWLNHVFYNQAFSEKEKRRIVQTKIVTDSNLDTALHINKVFILSKAQIVMFLPDAETRIGYPTPYALQKGANVGYDAEKTSWWWTLPYIEEGCGQPPRMDYPSVVCQNGEINYHGRLVYHSDLTVRPVIKIKK